MNVDNHDLENLMTLSAGDAGHAHDFYRALMDAKLLVLLRSYTGGASPENGDKAAIDYWQTDDGDIVVPAFTSLERLTAAIDDEYSYAMIGASELFSMVRGYSVYLNPDTDSGRHLLPEDVEALVDGSLFETTATYVVEEDAPVLIGQPAQYPYALVDALTTLFSRRDQVHQAYVAQIFNPKRDTRPHLIVAIDSHEALAEIANQAGVVLREISGVDGPVDFVASSDPGLGDYFQTQVEPFYHESWGRRLRTAPVAGHA